MRRAQGWSCTTGAVGTGLYCLSFSCFKAFATSTASDNTSCTAQGAKPVPLALSLLAGAVVQFLVPVPEGLTRQAWSLLSLFVTTIAGTPPNLSVQVQPLRLLCMICIIGLALQLYMHDVPASSRKLPLMQAVARDALLHMQVLTYASYQRKLSHLETAACIWFYTY